MQIPVADMRIPDHYTIVGGYLATQTVEKRGGPINSVTVSLPFETGFSNRFGRRVKRVKGTYSKGRNNDGRRVTLPWTNKALVLLREMMDFYHRTGAVSTQVVLMVNKEQYTVQVALDTPLGHIVETAAELKVYRRAAGARPVVWATRKEAEACLVHKQEQMRKEAAVFRERKSVKLQLVEAFNNAGFPTQLPDRLSFDTETSRRLIEFLKGLSS